MKKLAAAMCTALLAASPLAAMGQGSASALGEQKSPSPLGEGRGEGEVKKAPAKKPAPKKPAAPKKPVAKPAPAKPAPPAAPNVTVYKSSQHVPPTLRDKEGNLIPTDPNAYDVSSATGKKK